MDEPVVAVEQRSPALASAGSLEAGVQIGDFHIERRLGAGGMGIVYQARQISLGRQVALKVLGQALSRGTDVSRFQREAQAAARLRHPSIAQVYYIGQDRHICYMAMELVEGISLRRVLDRLGTTNTAESGLDSAVREDLGEEPQAAAVRFDLPTEAMPGRNALDAAGGNSLSLQTDDRSKDLNPYLSPKARELRTSQPHVRRCAEVARDAAHALAHAHEQGVVHRDIKPDNLLLDRKGKLHLIDFGVARFFEDQAVTCTGQLVGTPLYMSPEQVTGRGAVDARTDLYSLGLVLYELLTLRPPVEATNRENLLRNIVTKPLPPIGWRNSAVPEDLARIVHRVTQKDPDQRYASAVELSADLDRFLAGKPVAAPHYHFRLDEREIVGARPGEVVLSAFIILLVALCAFMLFCSTGLMMGTMFMGTMSPLGVTMMVAQIAIGGAILAGALFVTRGLLAARFWARWAGVVVLSLLCLASVVGMGGVGMMTFALGAEVEAQSKASQDRSATGKADAKGDLPLPVKNFVFGMMAFYGFPLVMGLFLGTAGVWGLLNRKTGEWFHFAAQIRLEHRQLKELLE